MIDGLNPQTPTWRAAKAYFRARIAELHQQLEQPHNEVHTAMLRGRIMELRSLEATAEPDRVDDFAEDTEARPPLYG